MFISSNDWLRDSHNAWKSMLPLGKPCRKCKMTKFLSLFCFFYHWVYRGFFTQNVFCEKFWGKNKTLKKGVKRVPKSSKNFWVIFWVRNVTLWKIKVSNYLTQKKRWAFGEKQVNSSNFFVYFFLSLDLPWFFTNNKHGFCQEQSM